MHAEILDKSQEQLWDDFVFAHPLGTIHQTSKWAHFQEKITTRGKFWIIILKEKEKIIGGTIVVRHKMAKDSSWFYCGRGPLLDYKSPHLKEQLETILKVINPLAAQEKAVFIRIDPQLSKEEFPKIPKLKNFYISHLGFQPENTIILDLNKSEQELLNEMKPKGRYNIKLAEKKGVTIRESDPHQVQQFYKDVESFHKILHETTMRDKFYGHRKNVYKDMLEVLALPKTHQKITDISHAKLYLAEYEGQPIAGMIATFFRETATYYYGASSDKFRNIMAPYLLQWTVIRQAKENGYKIYDFLGIAPPNAKNHPWQGVTDFKKKFGGKELAFQPCLERPFKTFLYLSYRIYKFLRK